METFIETYGIYFGIYITFTAAVFAVILPEDILLLAVGFLLYQDIGNPYIIVLVSFLGVLSGDLMLFCIAYFFQENARKIPVINRLFQSRVHEKLIRYFHKYSVWTIFITRFIGGLRAPAFMLAGMMRIPVLKFLAVDLSAAILSVPAFLMIGYFFGDNIHAIKAGLVRTEHIIFWIGLIVVIIFLIFRWIRRKRV
jgi:membrane protein DedA with SNARE-associated domain